MEELSERLLCCLTCPICLELVPPPVLCCEVCGIAICDACFAKWRASNALCPVCRGVCLEQVRNRIVEEIAQYVEIRCRNESCGQCVPFAAYREHLARCVREDHVDPLGHHSNDFRTDMRLLSSPNNAPPMSSTPLKFIEAHSTTSASLDPNRSDALSVSTSSNVSPIALCLSPASRLRQHTASGGGYHTPIRSPFGSRSDSSPVILLSPPTRALLSPRRLFSVSSASSSFSDSPFANIQSVNSLTRSDSLSPPLYELYTSFEEE